MKTKVMRIMIVAWITFLAVSKCFDLFFDGMSILLNEVYCFIMVFIVIERF